ncbi:unnamed protein product [Somion occarium]|uniref:Acetyl-CoA synthetase-like protein n=1 Tax=Somion occarium TaxID=3059160 RepID=A0ABP1DZM2_9APHY
MKSLYPPVPPIPDENHHYWMSGIRGQDNIADYVLHIDALSGRVRTRKEFNELVLDGATALGAPVAQGGLGLSGEAGDIVGVYSTNCLDYIPLMHSLIAIATPFALISSFSTPFELSHALRTAKPTRLFVQPNLLSKALSAASEIGLPSDRIYVLEGHVEGRRSFADMVHYIRENKTAREPVRAVTKDTLAYLVFSSGTSGLPKAVMISHGNLWFTIQAYIVVLQEQLKHTQQVPPSTISRMLAALPFHHSYGLHMFCLRGFLFPMTYVILPKWGTKSVLEAISKYKVTVFPMVPSMLHQLVNSKLLDKADLSSVQQVMCGAAATPGDLVKKLRKSVPGFQEFMEGYGLSEVTVSACLKPPPGIYGLESIMGSCGTLLPGMEARLVKDDGSEAGVNEPGEIWLRGGNVALGYYGDEQATKETFVDGWLRTGDKLKTDGRNILYFVERVKDTLKISGVQVSPTEIENVIRAHPGNLIMDISVAGVSGGRTSDEKVPRAWVVLSDEGTNLGAEKTLKTLQQWVEKNLSRYKWLRGGLEVVDEIPKLPTGKVLRRVLQDRYEQRLRLPVPSKARL